MSLNNIRFNASAIAELYRNSLIETTENTSSPAQPSAITTDEIYLGENRKYVLIVVEYPHSKFIPDKELSFLTNMLNACNLSLADVAIVNRSHHQEKTYKDLLGQLKSRIVFLFGVEPSSFGLPVSFPEFQIQPFANATFLFSPTLDRCNQDALVKSKLWVCLRRIFAI